MRFPGRIQRDAPGLAGDYSVRLGKGEIARIKLERLDAGHAWIDWVFVPPQHRGKGVARQLMRQVTADADADGVELCLEPRACAGLDQAALERWYEGFGFHDTGRQGELARIFARRPAAATLRRAAA